MLASPLLQISDIVPVANSPVAQVRDVKDLQKKGIYLCVVSLSSLSVDQMVLVSN